jgi:fibro-slime domain-containing protein
MRAMQGKWMQVLWGLVFAVATGHAQSPAETLNGKTIHLIIDPVPGAAFYFQNDTVPMTKVSPHEWVVTTSGQDPLLTDFNLRTNWTRDKAETFAWKVTPQGLSQAEASRFPLAAFQGQSELWIVVDPAGPVTAPPVVSLKQPKVVHILNPWPSTAPQMRSGIVTRSMFVTPGTCGWFSVLLLGPNLGSGHFMAIGGDESYGKNGWVGHDDFDFNELFAGKGDTLWLNTEANAWSTANPGMEGLCEYGMRFTVHDMSRNHPDFDFANISGSQLTTGMVKPRLGPGRKPSSTQKSLPAPQTYDTFDTWWITDTTATDTTMRNYPGCAEITLKKTKDGGWRYDSYWDSPIDHGFFPTTGLVDPYPSEAATTCAVTPPPGNEFVAPKEPKRNFNFCVESHASFIYVKGQKFHINGDDDLWIFINDKLVVDRGGIHPPVSDSVDLDQLGLVQGQDYAWDIFQCDRQPCASTLRLSTNIYFKQKSPLNWVLETNSNGVQKIQFSKIIGASEKCAYASSDSTQYTTVALKMELHYSLDGLWSKQDDLSEGTNHNGGIILSGSNVTLDTTKLRAAELRPGAYRIVAYEPANPKTMTFFQFRVSGATTALQRKLAPRGMRHKTGALPNALGRRVKAKVLPRTL